MQQDWSWRRPGSDQDGTTTDVPPDERTEEERARDEEAKAAGTGEVPSGHDITGGHHENVTDGQHDSFGKRDEALDNPPDLDGQGGLDEQRDVTTGRRDDGQHDVVDGEHDVVDQQHAAAEKQHDVTGEHHDVTDKEQDVRVAGDSQDLSGSHTDVRDDDTDLHHETTGLRDDHTDLRDDTTDVRDDHTDLRDDTTDLRDQDTSLRDHDTSLRDHDTSLRDHDLGRRDDTTDVRDDHTDLRDDTTDLEGDGYRDAERHDGALGSVVAGGAAAGFPAATGHRAQSQEQALEQFMDPTAAESLRARWHDVQADFVDDPHDAVQRADGLATEVLEALSQTLNERKSVLDAEWRSGDETPDTEKLRLALRGYRDFFNRMLSI
jgi:hypothetical protein